MDIIKTYVLVQADEGNTASIIVATSQLSLIDMVKQAYNENIGRHPLPRYKGNRDFDEKQKEALIKMITKHDNWENGWHPLTNIEPHWQEWTLFICNTPDGIIEY